MQPGERDSVPSIFQLLGHSEDSRRLKAGFKVFAAGRSIEAARMAEVVVRIRCDYLRGWRGRRCIRPDRYRES